MRRDLHLARHCGKHGTRSNCNTNRNAITASLMSPPQAALRSPIEHRDRPRRRETAGGHG
jgi:hypothetical protein